MRISRLMSVLLSILMIFTSCVAVYAQNENLSAVGISDKNLSGDANGFISRAEFSYLVSKLLTVDDMQPINTKFTDVNEKNAYSGYISYLSSLGIVNGISETEFNPDGNVSLEAASKIVVGILGFNTYAKNRGGYPEGYLYAAVNLGIFNNLYVQGEYLTRSEALLMMENTLLAINGAKAFPIVQSYEGFDVPEKDEDIYLTTKLGYSVYKGIVKSVNVKNNSMVFYVESNVYETNHTVLTEKTEVTLNVSDKVNLAKYDRVPSVIWTDSEGNVTQIREKNGYSVEYGIIETVNGDGVLSSPYNVSAIEELTIVGSDEEFNFSEVTNFYYNEKKITGGADLSDSFVRFVVKNNDILDIFCYKLEKGGLIKSISTGEKTISYVSSNGLTKKWDDTKDTDELLVVIDGRVASFSEIKSNSVFDYYSSDDMAILVVSERTAVDVFTSYSSSQVTLGAFTYKKSDRCLFSKDGINFKTDGNVYELLNSEAEAYFAPNGKIAYLIKSNGGVIVKRFYGVINGILMPTGIETDSKIELYEVGENIEKKVYTLTEKTDYKDGINIETLRANVKNNDGEGIYYFTANAKGEITSVEECTPFTGYGEEAKWTGTGFTDEILPCVLMPNNKQLYFDGTKIVGIYESSNGEFKVSDVAWTSIYGRGANGTATIEFFSKEESAQPEIAVLCCNLENMAKSDNAYGIVTKKAYALNADGETVNTVEVVASSGSGTYFVSQETFDRLDVDDFVAFAQKVSSADDQLIISEVIDMSGEIDDWKVSLTKEAGLQRGIVRNVDSKRLYIESASKDDVYFMHPYSCFVLTANSDKNQKFATATAKDIDIGNKVCYYLRDGEIRVIIIEK